MQAYNEGVALVELLQELVERHPIHAETAEGWFDIAYQLLEVSHKIRREAWDALPAEARQRAIREAPELRHLAAQSAKLTEVAG